MDNFDIPMAIEKIVFLNNVVLPRRLVPLKESICHCDFGAIEFSALGTWR